MEGSILQVRPFYFSCLSNSIDWLHRRGLNTQSGISEPAYPVVDGQLPHIRRCRGSHVAVRQLVERKILCIGNGERGHSRPGGHNPGGGICGRARSHSHWSGIRRDLLFGSALPGGPGAGRELRRLGGARHGRAVGRYCLGHTRHHLHQSYPCLIEGSFHQLSGKYLR